MALGSSVGMTYENGTDVAADAAIDTQLQQYGTNILAGFDSSATATESSLISLGVSTVETDEDGRRSSAAPKRGQRPSAAAHL